MPSRLVVDSEDTPEYVCPAQDAKHAALTMHARNSVSAALGI